jgi:glycosyltransferase involved in cell wall biosynthesis
MALSTIPQPDRASPERAPLRVLHIGSGNLFGGIEVFHRSLALHRDAAPNMVQEFAYCFTGKAADEVAKTGAPVHILGAVRYSRPWTILAARRALRRLLRGRHYDIVLCQELWVYGVFAPTIRKSGPHPVLFVHDQHTGRDFLERLARRTPPDHVLANSRWCVEGFDRFLPGVPYRVYYCPVELDPPPSVSVRTEVRHRFEAGNDQVVILQVGRWEAHKGHLTHLEALAALRDIPSWVCWQVGAPQRPAEQQYFERVRARAAELGILDRIRFLGWQSDLVALRAAADIYCQPNTNPEPFGLTVVEALSAGLPVVASAEAGPLEIVTPECGLLAQPGNVDDLARKLRRLLTDDSERRRLASNGPRRARELCEPDQRVRHLAQIFGERVAARGAVQRSAAGL